MLTDKETNHLTRCDNRLAINFICMLLLFNVCVVHWHKCLDEDNIDFLVLWSLPESLNYMSVPDIYSNEGESQLSKHMVYENLSDRELQVAKDVVAYYKEHVAINSTPFLYSIVGLLKSHDYDKDLNIYILLSTMCLAGSVMLLCYFSGFSFMLAVILLVYLEFFHVPMLVDDIIGNITSFQILLLTLFVACSVFKYKYSSLLSGLALGLCVMLKPNVLFVLIFNVIILYVKIRSSKDCIRFRGFVTGVVTSLLVCILIGSAYFGGINIWGYFLHKLTIILNFHYPVDGCNYSLTNIIYSYTKTNYSLWILVVLVAGFLYFCLVNRRRIKRNSISNLGIDRENEICLAESFCVVGIGCATMFFSSGLAWVHYHVLLIPLLIFLLRPNNQIFNNGYVNLFVRLLPYVSLTLYSSANRYIFHTNLSFAVIFNVSMSILLFAAFHELSHLYTDSISKT